MNYRMSLYLIGQILLIVACLLLIPFVLTFVYAERHTAHAFGVTILAMALCGLPFVLKKPKNTAMQAKGGCVTVALAWVLLGLFGALPFTLSGYIPNYLDSLFEIVSGLTTTGATILSEVEALPNSLLFWRSFSHWIGGMGVLVFVIAVLPRTNNAIVHLAKAEIPGPQFGKLVSKLRFTARILYGIYIFLTLLEVACLLVCRMPVFDSFITAFATAGTGGFSNRNTSIAAYDSVAIETVVMIFMFIFSVNMNVFYWIIVGQFRQAFRNEELICLFAYTLGAIGLVSLSLSLENVYDTFGQTLRYSSFQVISIISTTGFGTADYTAWPVLAQTVLVICMFIGGMAGSTAGGLKLSRVIILTKASLRSVKKTASPRAILNIRMDGKKVEETVVQNAVHYFTLYWLLLLLSVLLVSLTEKADFATVFTSVVTCINNVGPGLGQVGPAGSFGGLQPFSKFVLILDMLLGRLEIYPVLLLFYPKAWKRG